jgi:hypothetical protein
VEGYQPQSLLLGVIVAKLLPIARLLIIVKIKSHSAIDGVKVASVFWTAAYLREC